MRSLVYTLFILIPASTMANPSMLMDCIPSGAVNATGGSFQLSGTVGQVAAGIYTASPYQAVSGFDAYDRFPPTIVCQDISVQLSGGTASIIAQDIDNGSTDNFSPLDLSIDIDTFTTSDVGPNTVTLTAQDFIGHKVTCAATVTVLAEPSAVLEWNLLDE